MNMWKPLALVSTGALVALIGYGAHTGTVPGVMNAQAGNQPNMEGAAAKLREARALLDRGEHNKGGHRARAQALTDQAIVEVDKGINYADK